MKRILIFLFIIVICVQCSEQQSGKIVLSNLKGNQSIDLPIELSLDSTHYDLPSLIAESIDDDYKTFILQRIPSSFDSQEIAYTTILNKNVTEGVYSLSTYKENPSFYYEDNGEGQLKIFENSNSVLTYNYGMQLKGGVKERYRRSSYIHPVYDLKGNILSDDFPKDHYHHRGLSWMWPKIFIDSVRYDLWHIYGKQGDLPGIHQVFEKWLYKEVGPVCASFGVKNVWKLASGQSVMDEWVNVNVFQATGKCRAIDIKLIFKARKEVEIEGQTKKGYGGLNFRFAPRRETQISSYLGIEKDSDLKRLPWSDQSAKFGSNDYFSGVSIFQSKFNEDFPAGWCLRHYGFLGVAWPGVKKYTIKIGEIVELNFRVLIHQGTAKEAEVEIAYRFYNDPPVIEYKNN